MGHGLVDCLQSQPCVCVCGAACLMSAAVAEVMEGLKGEIRRFVSSVDWSQRWLHVLGVYLAILLLAVLVTRRHAAWQLCLMGLCLLQAALCQPLNSLARAHWQSFASANYFGDSGFFVSIMFGLPHLLIAVVALTNLIVVTAQLAATVKRMQFQRERELKSKKKAE